MTKGGFVSSPVRHPISSEKSVACFPGVSDLNLSVESPRARAGKRLTAFSFEFVAKPERSTSAPVSLPAAIQSGLEDVTGFAGSLVMVSDQEARLITVIIFWEGSEARKSCAQSLRRLRALLAPYLDRCLRMQNMLAHLPSPPALRDEPNSIDTRYIVSESITQEANSCVA